MNLNRTVFCCTFLALVFSTTLAHSQSREEKVRGDKKKVEAEGFWIYNDLDEAFVESKKSGKPIIVNFRCIPCTECVKLDDDLVDADPVIRPLLEKFVRVRVVSTNGLDLNTFQFDTDQSFSVFFLNADGTVYGRFGTRSHHTEWYGDVSLPGMAEAMKGALALHKKYPANRQLLSGKQAKPFMFASPEKFPHLSEKYTERLNYEGDVVKSCIHCHQIGDAAREHQRKQTGTISDEWLSPYPHPKSIGLIMDAETRGVIDSVKDDSPAASAGLIAGDEIQLIAGQPVLSIADIQWALHNLSSKSQSVSLNILRNGQRESKSIQLPKGWKDLGDISWRVSSWAMRRMVTGGILLETANDEIREKLQLPDDKMALRAKHVGQYGQHGAAKRAGVKKDDILVSYDDKTDLMNDSQLLRYGLREKRDGDKVKIEVVRGNQRMTFTLPIQK